MPLPDLPPKLSREWYEHYTALHNIAAEVDSGRLTDDALKALAVDAVEAATTVTPTGAWDFAQAPTVGGVPISNFASRSLVSATTASLAKDASATLTIPLAIGFRLYSIQTSAPARVRLYDTAAHRAADAGRAVGVDPASDAGVILEYVTGDSATHSLSPMVDGASMESTPSASIAMTVTNLDTAAGTVAVTFSFLRTE